MSEDRKLNSVFSEEQMRKFGAEPCATCDSIPGFVPNGCLYRDKYPFHEFICPGCGQRMQGDFLAPNDEDKVIKYWNEIQRDKRSEVLNPFDEDWFVSEIKPALVDINKRMSKPLITHYDQFRFGRKSSLHQHLDQLQKELKELMKLSKNVRQKFVERHGEEFAKPEKQYK